MPPYDKIQQSDFSIADSRRFEKKGIKSLYLYSRLTDLDKTWMNAKCG